MNYIEGNRVVIITDKNLSRIEKGKESDKCHFYEDFGIIAFDRNFGQHQDCFNYFKECYYLPYSDINYLHKKDNNILLYIVGPEEGKYLLGFYLPKTIEEIQLAGLKELMSSIDNDKIIILAHRYNGETDERYSFDSENCDVIEKFNEFIISSYENNLKR